MRYDKIFCIKEFDVQGKLRLTISMGVQQQMRKWNFRNNLLYLRQANEESQTELAHRIGFQSGSAITQYESGARPKPAARVLKKIAIHYNITVDELCYGDFSYLVDVNLTSLPLDDMNKMNKLSAAMFPIINPSKKAFEDQFFAKGYEENLKIRDYFYNNEADFDSTIFKKCHDSYVESLNKNGTIESAANLLWFYVFANAIVANKNLMEGLNKLYSKRIEKDIFYKNYVLKSFEKIESNEDEAYTLGDNNEYMCRELKVLEEYADTDEETYAILYQYLKQTPQGCEYADYYMALQYIYNMVENDYDVAMNQTMGIELMRKFAIMENKYAKKYFALMEQFFGGN